MYCWLGTPGAVWGVAPVTLFILMFHSSPMITICFRSFAFLVAYCYYEILSIIIFLMVDFFPFLAFSPELISLSSSPSTYEYCFPALFTISSWPDDPICSSSSSYEYLILLFYLFVVVDYPTAVPFTIALLFWSCSYIWTLCYLTPFIAPARFPNVPPLFVSLGDEYEDASDEWLFCWSNTFLRLVTLVVLG